MKPGISAIIVTLNQGDLLKKCLESISSWVDEIIIIDVGSTEDIKSIAKNYHAKFISHAPITIVEEIRQDSLKNAKHEYVLFLDPDETIPTTLSGDLVERVKSKNFDYFVTPRQNYVFGKWVQNSRWWPDYQTRLIRQGKVTWGTDLHAKAETSGKSWKYDLDEKYAIKHENYRTIDEFLTKNIRYAKADASNRFNQKSPLSLTKAIKLSVSELISRFYASEGYKDGMHGLILSILQSFYYFMVYAYYWEYQKYGDLEPESTLKSAPRKWFAHAYSEVLFWDDTPNLSGKIKGKILRRIIK